MNLPRKARHARVFDFPWCIYCGGQEQATTVDHVPARNLFDGRIRPKGLEFPSCAACNAGTRITELVAAILCRVHPDAVTHTAQEELRKLLAGVSRNAPEVLAEMQTPRARAKFSAQRLGKPAGGFLRLDGPLVSARLEAFAAKFAYAFHFYITGKPIPAGGGAVSRIYSNVNLIDGELPDDVIAHLDVPNTLQQGTKHVGDQFRYGVTRAEDAEMSMGFASFRLALAFATFGADDISKLRANGHMPSKLFRPGDLRRPVPSPEFPTIYGTGRIRFGWNTPS